jgi:RNA 2',3'-cyclic 3'-phosphodiesterase
MKRLFAAIRIEPSERYIHQYSGLTAALRHERIRWVEPENTHLTLKFFGETDEDRIPSIEKALKASVAGIAPFTLRIAGTGIFGSRYDPRVIWFGIEKNPSLDRLAAALFRELETAGWIPDRQNFVPHLTVGRIREIGDKALFQQFLGRYREAEIQQQDVTELVLYESILRREGPLYLKCSSFPLG